VVFFFLLKNRASDAQSRRFEAGDKLTLIIKTSSHPDHNVNIQILLHIILVVFLQAHFLTIPSQPSVNWLLNTIKSCNFVPRIIRLTKQPYLFKLEFKTGNLEQQQRFE
jgi:hypothetical protein